MSDVTRNFNLSAKIIATGVFLLLIGSAFAATIEKTAAATSKKDVTSAVRFPEEDSDMLMEPNDFAPITVLRSHERQFHAPPIMQQQFRPIIHPQLHARVDAHPIHADSHTQAAQNFFPPFFREAPPLGHSRPYFTPPTDIQQPPLINKYSDPQAAGAAGGVPHAQQRGFDTAVLGSGDFGILRGGTFYPEEEMPYHPEENTDFNQYYGDVTNGHGRPSSDGFIEKYTYPEEQFANFRDFADINTPADSAFSQFVVVYAAKNATNVTNTHPRPKNIFEQLQLLDEEKALEEKKAQRVSKTKTKLSKSKLQKKYQKKKPNPKDWDYEPLLALS